MALYLLICLQVACKFPSIIKGWGDFLHAAILSTGAQSQQVLMGPMHEKVRVFFFKLGSCFVQAK